MLSVDEWMRSHKLKSLGVPRYIATGNHQLDGSQYRFLIMDRFGTDLQKLFEQAGKRFPTSTVFLLGLKLVSGSSNSSSSSTLFLTITVANLFLYSR